MALKSVLAALATAAALVSTAASAQTIALVQINQQALFFNQMNEGAQAAADEVGAELVIFNANNDPAAQNNAMETYIAQGVDAIIIVAIDVNGVMPAVEQADAAGIPVLAVDAILPDGPQKAQIGVDNMKAGADMAAHFLEATGGNAKVGIVGALNSFIQNVRQEGFEKGIEGASGVETVGVVDGRNVQDTALAAAENLMTANPTMDAIYATGEPALVGAVAAVEAQGATDRVSVFGWDLTAQVIDAIDQGYVKAVIQQSPYDMGATAVRSAKTLIDGGTVEKVISVPVTIVTKENVDDFRSIFQ
ncbi:substrate-binding domain-containing protein [Acuticoccus kandeliae]|uniref:substrate-binding domain-containing protein n=1 Tax=Acuticoccus kandeliae TaxID=2073160 RepID=UPI000D3E8B71|nr:substrate-binding domain-containing protein [Acuticoccus kandeliae]